jgi:hypothetical protein
MGDETVPLSKVKVLKRLIALHHTAIIGAGKGLRTELMHRGKNRELARLARKRSGWSSRPRSRWRRR